MGSLFLACLLHLHSELQRPTRSSIIQLRAQLVMVKVAGVLSRFAMQPPRDLSSRSGRELLISVVVPPLAHLIHHMAARRTQ